MCCIQEITEEYRTRMYRLLDLYSYKKYDPKYPLVCMDEKSKQLLEDSRQSIKASPGKLEKYDYEYKRKATVRLRTLCLAVMLSRCLLSLGICIPGSSGNSMVQRNKLATTESCFLRYN